MPEHGRSGPAKRGDELFPDAGEDAALPGVAELVEREGRLPSDGLKDGLRTHTARGTIINAGFQISIAVLNLIRRLIVAGFLTAAEFGIWGAMLTSLFVVVFLKDAGFGDKFIQQAEADQAAAFHKLFTLELMLAGVVIALGGIAIPLFAAAYGQPEIIVPGLVLSLAVLGSSLQSPTLIFYRRMDFVRQRTLQSVDPVTAFFVTVGLAIAGAGYWSLVVGAVVGSFAGAGVSLWMCPYPLGLRFKWSTLSDYFHFLWPLVLARGEFIMVGQASLLIATRTAGIAAAGAIALATGITQFSQGVDNIVTQTAYPAICAVRHRQALLFEAFVKSNRFALMWGMPFGFGTALFAPDLVHFVLGNKWEPAIVVLQALGIVAGIDQLGFNWTAFLRALGFTRPLATLAVLDLIAFLVATTPLLIAFGLPGFAAGVLIAEVVRLGCRSFYLRKLFPQFHVWRHVVRAVAPVVPGVLLVGIARLLEVGARTPTMAILECAVFVISVIVATVVLERQLLTEMRGYLTRARSPSAKTELPAQ